MFRAYRRYADFTGRSNRSEYWFFVLGLLLIVVGLSAVRVILEVLLGDLGSIIDEFGLAVVLLGSAIPGIAVQFRRLHDIDRSAWWGLLGLIPLLGALVLLVLHLLPGTSGPNRFGAPPGETAASEVFA